MRMEFVVVVRLVGVMNLVCILPCPFSIQGREPYLHNFLGKRIVTGLYSDIFRLVSFKVGMILEITTLYILISVLMTLIFKSKTLVSIFWQILPSIWMNFSILPQLVDLLKLSVEFLCKSHIQGRELS